jgi:hypothetical protein
LEAGATAFFEVKCRKTHTNRILAAQMGFCPHGREVGSHETANSPHGLNFRRTNGKMAARNDFCPHGTGNVPHGSVLRLRETISASNKDGTMFQLVTAPAAAVV